MNEFTHEMFGTLRTVEVDGEPWFVATDVAKALGYARPNDALHAHVDPEDIREIRRSEGTAIWRTFHNRVHTVKLINESGLYSLVFSSALDSAKQFKRWVTSEVLPSIRKHGQYNMVENDAPAWVRDLMSKVDAISTLAKAHNEVQETSKGYSLAETARRMGIPPRRFNAILRELGIVTRPDNIPTEFGREMGYVARRGNTAAVPESGYEGLRVVVTQHLATHYTK